MSDTVWVVTVGSYSDYHIVAVFTDQAALDRYMATVPLNDYDVEAWQANAPGVLSKDMHAYVVYLHPEAGEVERVVHVEVDDANEGTYWRESWKPGARWDEWFMSDATCRADVRARDIEHAKKIAADKWAQWRSEQEDT